MADRCTEPPRIDETAIAEQAARWQRALKTAGAPELAEFSAWLKMSPRHGHHFLCATAIDRLLDQIDPDKIKFDPHAWVREARENVVALHANLPSVNPAVETNENATLRSSVAASGRHRRRFFLGALAAGILSAALITGWPAIVQTWGWTDWATSIGEQRTVELEDGSILYLNTATRIRVRLNAEARDIRLVAGEALFKVHRDPDRPFRVYTPGSIIQAVGTQFNVYQREGGTRVSVLEGAVRITAENPRGALTRDATDLARAHAASLTAGQAAEINPDGQLSQRPMNVVEATAWRQRRLVFRADPLADMVAEFNRYNQAPQFRLEGVDGRARHYTGTFDADDPESFASVLSQENFYAVERTPSDIVIRPRH